MFHLLLFLATVCILVSLQQHGMLLPQEHCSLFTTSQGVRLMLFDVSGYFLISYILRGLNNPLETCFFFVVGIFFPPYNYFGMTGRVLLNSSSHMINIWSLSKATTQ